VGRLRQCVRIQEDGLGARAGLPFAFCKLADYRARFRRRNACEACARQSKDLGSARPNVHILLGPLSGENADGCIVDAPAIG
jgi:hypothetical protein